MKAKLTRECFDNQMVRIALMFDGILVTPERMEVWYSLLKDCEEEYFEMAIDQICIEVKNIYPSTNIIAVILEYIKTIEEEGSETLY